MPGEACIEAMLAELRPVEPLDDVARRELDELVKGRYTLVSRDCVMDNITLEIVPVRQLAKPPPRLERLLYQEIPGLHWEEKFAILVVLWTALRFFI